MSKSHKEALKKLICDVCVEFYHKGWAVGTSGSAAIKYNSEIITTPSGLAKESLQPVDLFVIDGNNVILSTPPSRELSNGSLRPAKLSDSSVLFTAIMRARANVECVLHSHSVGISVVTQLPTCTRFNPQTNMGEFHIRQQEMIKGIAGHGFHDELVIPIIENTAFEYELTDSLTHAVNTYPKSYAVLVRNHGLYLWGETFEVAKRHAECLHYLFDVAVEMHKCGLSAANGAHATTTTHVHEHNHSHGHAHKRKADEAELTAHDGHHHGHEHAHHDHDHKHGHEHKHSKSCGNDCQHSSHNHSQEHAHDHDHAHDHSHNHHHHHHHHHGKPKYKHYIFDIEGTTTPITFVKDVLFPYARQHVREYLNATWLNPQTVADVEALYKWAHEEPLSLPIPARSDSKVAQVDFLVALVEAGIDRDSKHGALKQLQGHMWKLGYETGSLVSTVYDDIPPLFASLSKSSKVCIYSSGSRQAQQSLFRYTQVGDLRQHIVAYFDTTVGTKRDSKSYENILLTLGYDHADPATRASIQNDVLFVTDILEEAQAAAAAGMSGVLSVRPGNAPLPPQEQHGFKTATSFDQLE